METAEGSLPETRLTVRRVATEIAGPILLWTEHLSCSYGLRGAAQLSRISPKCCLFSRFIFVSNHLPIRCSRSADGNTWDFAWDDDALIAQAKVHRVLDVDALFVAAEL